MPQVTPGRISWIQAQAFRLVAVLAFCAPSGAGPLRAQEAPAPVDEPFAVNIAVHADRSEGELKPIWRYFGADEPNYATMPNGKKLLGELGELAPGEVFFRAHSLMNTGNGEPALKWGSTNLYTESEEGRPVYDFAIVDGIFDAYLERGVRPYAQLGFMPKALSSRPEPYRHNWRPGAPYGEIYTGWAYPPDDYEKWGETVYQWARHCVERYGEEEVNHWYWQTWNEPNIGYWRGTPEEFQKLHDYAIAAVRRAAPGARVGGPDVAGDGGRFMRDFLEHCLRGENHATGQIGTPIDFVSFHAKGAPRTVEGRVRMGIANQLRTIDAGCALIAEFPELKATPIVIGESDPEGCAACQGPELAYRNGTMYSSYTAATFARKQDIADRHGVNLEGALTWAFEFEGHPYFAGFRSLATGGIDKPVLNTFRMFSKMPRERLAAESDAQVPLDRIVRRGVRRAPDVGVLATRDESRVCVMVWHYHDDDLAGPVANVQLRVDGLNDGATMALEHYRIDHDHSNAYTLWRQMGSPQAPTEEQLAELFEAGQLQTLGPAEQVTVVDGAVVTPFELPRQGVSLLVLKKP